MRKIGTAPCRLTGSRLPVTGRRRLLIKRRRLFNGKRFLLIKWCRLLIEKRFLLIKGSVRNFVCEA